MALSSLPGSGMRSLLKLYAHLVSFRVSMTTLFVKRSTEGIIIVLVYVDDMLITGSQLKLIEDTKVAL